MKEILEARDSIKKVSGVNTKLTDIIPEPSEYPVITMTPDIESPFTALTTNGIVLDLMFSLNIYVARTEILSGYNILDKVAQGANVFSSHTGNSLGTLSLDTNQPAGVVSPEFTDNYFKLSIPYKIKKIITE